MSLLCQMQMALSRAWDMRELAVVMVSISKLEFDRLEVLLGVQSGHLQVADASTLLGLSRRQVFRLLQGPRDDGASSLVSRRRSRPSNRRLPDAVRQPAVTLVREYYADFGPTLAAEKLAGLHRCKVSPAAYAIAARPATSAPLCSSATGSGLGDLRAKTVLEDRDGYKAQVMDGCDLSSRLRETFMQTAFYTHEMTFWHSTGVQSLFFPIGGWIEPPSGTYGADTPSSKRRILSLIQVSGLAEKLAFPVAAPAREEDLARVHTPTYLAEFKRVSNAGGGDLGMLAPFAQGGYEIATVSAGLAIDAVEDVLSGRFANAYALCRPSGHHCMPDMPMGFCLLANTALAIQAARQKRPGLRVAVVDWDMHFANGTQGIFYEDGDVLTISLHQEGCRPPGQTGGEVTERGSGAGLGANLNIPMPPGCGHAAYLYAFERLVVPALRAFKPDLVIVGSGLDANAVDPLSRLLLHSDSYRELTATMMALASDLCAGRLVMIHEGGYAEAYVPFCGLAIMETMAKHRTEVVDPALEIFRGWQPSERFDAYVRSVIDDYASMI